MYSKDHKYARILAIDPTYRGFAFALMESSGRLIEWGKTEIHVRKHKVFLDRISQLLLSRQPRWLAVEDCSNTGRHERAQILISKMVDQARWLDVRRSLISRDETRSILGLPAEATKYDIAVAIAGRMPELRNVLPDPRKLGDSENDWMNVFDAVGLALVTQHYEYGRHSKAA